MRTNSRPDLQAELRVEKERFPYKVFFGERIVAHLFTHTLLGAISHAFQHAREMNDLSKEYNLLLDMLKGRTPVPEDIMSYAYKKMLSLDLSNDTDDFFRGYGVKVDQIWKTKGSHHHYKVVEVKLITTEVTLQWIGPWKYSRVLTVDGLKKKYELIENANEKLILIVTTQLEKQ